MRITVDDAVRIIVISGGYALVVAAFLWIVSAPLRRRSMRAALLVQGIVCLAATLAGVLGTARAMFLSTHDLRVIALDSGAVAIVVSGTALLLSRQIATAHGVLTDTASRLGTPDLPDAGAAEAPAVADGRPGRPLAQEVENVRRSLVEAGRALAESRARERSMAVAQREMIAAMSHDLRTPLAGIRAMAEALEDGIAPDPPAYLERMRVSADRLAAMVDALFELARPQGVVGDTPPAPVPLDDIVSDCLAGMDALARARNVTLTGRAVEPVQLLGSTSEMTRAVENVVTNALTATPAGGSVDVVVEQVAGVRPGARITVTDTCGGIADADLEHVFDVGFRGSRPRDRARATSAGAGGAGLGLAVTRRIVEAHHGTVSVSNVSGGCRFVLELPVGG